MGSWRNLLTVARCISLDRLLCSRQFFKTLPNVIVTKRLLRCDVVLFSVLEFNKCSKCPQWGQRSVRLWWITITCISQYLLFDFLLPNDNYVHARDSHMVPPDLMLSSSQQILDCILLISCFSSLLWRCNMINDENWLRMSNISF